MIYNLDNKKKAIIEIGLAAFLFLFVMLDFISLFKLIATLLAFIVILEVVRMIADFVLEGKKVMKLRFVIDGFILFFLRDIVLVFSEEKYTQEVKEEKLLLLVMLVFAFFIFRILALKYSPNDKNCETCPSASFIEKDK